MQAYCCHLSQKVAQNVILLGDFNIDEAKVQQLWDGEIDLDYFDELNGPFILDTRRKTFLSNFNKCILSNVTTNLFPFLAAFENGIPKHNDNIWISKSTIQFSEPDEERYKCALPPPACVLYSWDEQVQSLIRKGLPKEFKNKVSNIISLTWSDHRPICTDITFPSFLPRSRLWDVSVTPD